MGLTIAYSTRNQNDAFKAHLKSFCNAKDLEILEFINNGDRSLTSIYNEVLDRASNNIIIFCHDDILFSKPFGKDIIKHFTNTDYAILGVAGTTNIDQTGRWWNDPTKMIGVVKHTHNNKTWESKYSGSFDQILDAVLVDGLFFCVDRTKIKSHFNESFTGFHFYDVSFMVDNYLQGCKIGVMFDVKITHKSIGRTNDEWEKNRIKFATEYKDKLPLNIVPNIIIDDINIKLKDEPKLAIVILTKNNFDILNQCIESIKTKTSYTNYKIYIGDTGSDDENLNKIKNLESDVIKVITLDHYNFGQNNNEIVNNFIDDDTELILFSNNDIKLLNDAISRMVKVYFKHQKTCGTVGCRLHYGDNRIQHAGMIMWVDDQKRIQVSHKGLFSYYSYDNYETVIGNTGAFLLISKELFKNIGGFNEKYIECFEDVELNLKCLVYGKDNIFVGDGVCYHYESMTRNNNNDKISRLQSDYINNLLPFLKINLANSRVSKFVKNLVVK